MSTLRYQLFTLFKIPPTLQHYGPCYLKSYTIFGNLHSSRFRYHPHFSTLMATNIQCIATTIFCSHPQLLGTRIISSLIIIIKISIRLHNMLVCLPAIHFAISCCPEMGACRQHLGEAVAAPHCPSPSMR